MTSLKRLSSSFVALLTITILTKLGVAAPIDDLIKGQARRDNRVLCPVNLDAARRAGFGRGIQQEIRRQRQIAIQPFGKHDAGYRQSRRLGR